jgi:hypothetical protein
MAWYHGTFIGLREGDVLKHGGALGGTSLWGQAKHGQVYFTNHLPTAIAYGQAYAQSAREAGLAGKSIRARVYEVHPTKEVEWDTNEGEDYPYTKTDPVSRKSFTSATGSVRIGKLVHDEDPSA